MIPKSFIVRLWVVAAAVALVLGATNLYFGDVNQDEGWYLYSARLVARGELPYRDFAFTQAPATPFVYSLAQPLVDRWGVAGGRLFTAGLALLAALAAALLAARLVDEPRKPAAAFLAFALISVNVYQSYFTTVVKTYSLSSLLLGIGFLLLTFVDDKRRTGAALLAGAALTLAAATRVSVGIALPVVLLFLYVGKRRWPWEWLWFGLGCILTAAIVFLPFFLAARESFLFGMMGYHTLRDAGGLLHMAVYKAGFISRLAQAYFVALGLWAAMVLARVLEWREKNAEVEPPVLPAATPAFSAALWAVVLAVSAAHFLAPFPYEDYQVMIFPVFAAVLAAALVRRIRTERMMRWTLLTVLFLCTASSFSSPLNQDWFLQERDRIWWRLRTQTPLQKLRRTGLLIRRLSRPGDLLLTQDTYLAVESGLSVPRGLELGPFSYYPDWSEEQARAHHVVNRAMLREMLESSEAPLAALSGYSLAIGCPGINALSREEQEELRALVERNYEDVFEVRHFGQAATTLRLLARKPRPATSPALRRDSSSE